MARTEVTLPRLAETVDEVVISQWLVDVGTTVDVGTAILSVETDKALMDVPSPVAGTLAEQLVTPDDEVATGTVIAVIEHA